MKKLLLLLITLITFTNITYASFPVSDTLKVKQDTLQTEEIKQYHYTLQKMGFDLSSCKCISCRNGVDPIVIKPKPIPVKLEDAPKEEEKRGPSAGLYVLFSILSGICSLLFGFLSLGNALSHGGSYSAVLSFFLLFVISALGSVILAVKAKKQGVKWGVAMLGVGIALFSLLFFLPAFFG